MKKELFEFDIFPSVVKANEINTVRIYSKNSKYAFTKGREFVVTVCPREYHDTPIDKEFTLGGYNYKKINVLGQGDYIEFSYNFIEEQQWDIIVNVSEKMGIASEYTKEDGWGWEKIPSYTGKIFQVYSLKEDLYSKNVYRGDMHLHSNQSDGNDDPHMVFANCRRHGYDYCALTDHHYFHSSKKAKEKMDELKTEFTAYLGEEVHNKSWGNYHVVNFGGESSVNDIILEDVAAFNERIWEESKNLTHVKENIRPMVAGYKIIADEIKKAGGLAIFAHPFWGVFNSFNCPVDVAEEVFKNGYYDACELLGGLTTQENNLQLAFYNDFREKGIKLPVVGSTDCHDSHEEKANLCAYASTIAFCDDRFSVKEAVKSFNTVAVESRPNESERVYGDFRLVKYTNFLLENYFPLHNIYCNASGTLMLQYFSGDKTLKDAIEKAEDKIREYTNKFFNKNN